MSYQSQVNKTFIQSQSLRLASASLTFCDNIFNSISKKECTATDCNFRIQFFIGSLGTSWETTLLAPPTRISCSFQ